MAVIHKFFHCFNYNLHKIPLLYKSLLNQLSQFFITPYFRQARRFNEWYRERSRNGETDEEVILSTKSYILAKVIKCCCFALIMISNAMQLGRGLKELLWLV